MVYFDTSPADTLKIELHVIKVWNLVQMKLVSRRSGIDLGAFRTFSPSVCMPICCFNTGREKFKKIICFIQLFELFSAVGSVFQINRTGKNTF